MLHLRKFEQPDRIVITVALWSAAMTLILTILKKGPIETVVTLTMIALLLYGGAFIWIVSRTRRMVVLGIICLGTALFGWHEWPKPPILTALPARWEEADGLFKVPIVVKANSLKRATLTFEQFFKVPCDRSSICDMNVPRRIGWANGRHSWDPTEISGQREFFLFFIQPKTSTAHEKLVVFYEGVTDPSFRSEFWPQLKDMDDIPEGKYEMHLVLESDADPVFQSFCVQWNGHVSGLKIEQNECR